MLSDVLTIKLTNGFSPPLSLMTFVDMSQNDLTLENSIYRLLISLQQMSYFINGNHIFNPRSCSKDTEPFCKLFIYSLQSYIQTPKQVSPILR